MALVTTKYGADNGTIHPIRIGDDIAGDAQNTPPAGAVLAGTPSAKVSKNIREYGVEPRQLLLFRTVGTPPDTARKYKVFPVLDPGQFDVAQYDIGATITLNSIAWTVLGKASERFK